MVWLIIGAVFLLIILLWVLRINSWFPLVFQSLKARLPRLSQSESQAMGSGDAWWEQAAFKGVLDWGQLTAFSPVALSAQESAFLNDVVDPFCVLIDSSLIEKIGELPDAIWSYIAEHRLWGITLSHEDGGLGLSAVALAAVIARIASRNVAVAITVMVPNTIGPAAFIALHGTPEQRKMLPEFAAGRWVGSFALTSTLAGSDAAHLPDRGLVCYGVGDHAGMLGLRLNWDKRYITLAPRANYLCLACRVQDPDAHLPEGTQLGMSLVLVPTDLSGVTTGHAHQPMTSGLCNGTTQGQDVWLPLTNVIGGRSKIGAGWQMMMDELAAGRGLSLPSLATGLCQMAFRMTHIYAQTRRQFSRPLLGFSGIASGHARLAGFALLSKSVHWFTVQGIAKGLRPAIAAAVAKYHLTELARQSVNIAMDIHAGRAAQLGVRNYLSQMYHALPVMVTVEGANILTRNLIIFGQGLIRCHPFVAQEWAALSDENKDQSIRRFDRVFWRHVGSFLTRGCQVAWYRLTRGKYIFVPKSLPHRSFLKHWIRLSRVFIWVTDVYLLKMGGKLKENERISALLGDVVSHLYMMLCVWMYERHQPDAVITKGLPWAMNYCQRKTQLALMELVAKFPSRPLRALMRCVVFPARLVYDEVSDELEEPIAAELLLDPSALEALTPDCFTGQMSSDATGRMEQLNALFLKTTPVLSRLQKALGVGFDKLPFGNDWNELPTIGRSAGLSASDCQLLQELADACWDCLQVD